MKVTLALTIATMTVAGMGQTARAATAKPCATIPGPTAHAAGMSFDHYAIYRIGSSCRFALQTVASILTPHLPNSRTPVRTKAPAGWVCVAEEVDDHVAVTGHCVKGRSAAISWIGAGLNR